MAGKPAFTSGKRGVKTGNTGKFSGSTGGHTSEGHTKPATGASVKSGDATSSTTSRIGKLGIRTRGNAGTFKKDHYGI